MIKRYNDGILIGPLQLTWCIPKMYTRTTFLFKATWRRGWWTWFRGEE